MNQRPVCTRCSRLVSETLTRMPGSNMAKLSPAVNAPSRHRGIATIGNVNVNTACESGQCLCKIKKRQGDLRGFPAPPHQGERRLGMERLMDIRGWNLTPEQQEKEALLVNLNLFKTAADAFADQLDALEPNWKQPWFDGTMHVDEKVRDAYRAWKRARVGIDASLQAIAALKAKEK